MNPAGVPKHPPNRTVAGGGADTRLTRGRRTVMVRHMGIGSSGGDATHPGRRRGLLVATWTRGRRMSVISVEPGEVSRSRKVSGGQCWQWYDSLSVHVAGLHDLIV